MDKIDIKGKDKSEILAALYNASRPQGLGMLHFTPDQMSVSEAKSLLAERSDFDYLKGRVMKINLSKDELDPRLYDRDNGPGAAEKALRVAGIL